MKMTVTYYIFFSSKLQYSKRNIVTPMTYLNMSLCTTRAYHIPVNLEASALLLFSVYDLRIGNGL